MRRCYPERAGSAPAALLASASVDLGPLVRGAETKILLVVLDGLGGLADGDTPTELEEAQTPNLDRLVTQGVSGLLEPVGPGITPGSGPGHLALFGYDPLGFELGRGALSAAGLGFELLPGDVAARGNLCTLDAGGRVTDRRAGRIVDAAARAVVEKLQAGVSLDGVEVFFRHERQHRVLVVLRGHGLDPRVTDTDPQTTGVPPLEPRPREPVAERTAAVADSLSREARRVLVDEPVANGLLLRGFDTQRELPAFQDRYGMRAAAVAVYPMYRGIARLLGFEVLGPPANLAEEVRLLEKHWDDAEFFFFHYKDTDSAGEDGDRAAKVAALERFDAVVPDLMSLSPDVAAFTGDHVTPSQMAAHSWHPVPVLVTGRRVGRDTVTTFGERWCLTGGIGIRRSKELMPLLLANAGRLAKFGA